MKQPKDMTKRERQDWMYGIDALRMIEHDIHAVVHDIGALPLEWHEIARDEDRRDAKRTRCTVAFDADVVRFFKAMGPGYQARMNRVLRAFMHFRLAKIVDGPDVNDYVLRPGSVGPVGPRTQWGDSKRQSDRRRG